MKTPTFLTAEWRYLAMLNYVVDPRVLKPFVPAGTQLDSYDGDAYVSVVGFNFANARVFAVPVPLCTDFEEVNLRFYVRRRDDGVWKRGVVFVREIVPRQAIAMVARACYGEPYIALPMRHEISLSDPKLKVRYEWQHGNRWNAVEAEAEGEPAAIVEGSVEEFITEHYWGYTAHEASVSEYEVEHPQWRVWPATAAKLDCDVRALYGERFVESLSGAPSSAFIADGSPVIVRHGKRVREDDSAELVRENVPGWSSEWFEDRQAA